MFGKSFKEKIEEFISNYKWQVKEFTFKDGFFISPRSKINYEERARKPVIFLKETYLEVYTEKFKSVVKALKYFLKLNKIRLNELDTPQFATYLGLLSYIMALYKRRIECLDVKTLRTKWGNISNYITTRNIKKMYRDLAKYLAEKKRLTRDTINQILYNANPNSRAGFENILSILNILEKQFHPENPASERYLQKRLINCVNSFKKLNPMSNLIGTEFEKIIEDKLGDIGKQLQSKYRADKFIILNLDTDKKIKKKLKGSKIPDYIYLDSKLNVVPLDAKFNLNVATIDQVSARIIRGIFAKLEISAS